jgi:multimeric flavodoxin WrbA
MSMSERMEQLVTESRWDFSDLSALFINCTLKKSPELSHTQGLMDIAIDITEKNGVSVENVRAVDTDFAIGVWPDMTEHGAERDDWPALYEKVQAADILVLGSAIWLGEKTSVCTHVIERLYGNLMHLARMLKDAGGMPAHGNQRALWDAGCRFDFVNPEYR